MVTQKRNCLSLLFSIYADGSIFLDILQKCCFCFSVYADGSICLDILQNRWSPTYDVSAILTSIQVRYYPLTP